MTKTKTDYYGVLLLLIGTMFSTGLLIYMTYEWITGQETIGLIQRIFFTSISVLMTALLWTIEIPKLKSVEIDDKRIKFKNLLTGATKEILVTDCDGFKTSSQSARGGPVYEIIIFIKGKRFHDISSNYIKNYDEVRIGLGKRLDNLGKEKFKYFKYLKDRLTN